MSAMQIDRQVKVSLDLAESGEQISVNARVVWSDCTGGVGLGFSGLNESEIHSLREWLFFNALARAADIPSFVIVSTTTDELRTASGNTCDTFSQMQRETEALGTNIEAVLSLFAVRSHSLLRASGAAIALAGREAGLMTCRASAGQSAPPMDARLQVGSGFSGECVRSGRVLRCDDIETDILVDRESCQALGIRSILAAPLRSGDTVIGLLEVFSGQPYAFDENDSATLQRFAEMIVGAVNRATGSNDSSGLSVPSANPTISNLAGILSTSDSEDATAKKDAYINEDKAGGLRRTRAYRYLLYTSATIALILAFMLARWTQVRTKARFGSGESTVLEPPTVEASKADPSLDTGEIEQLRTLATHGNPVAENAMGLLYAQGDEKHGINHDQSEAVRWFSRAAEHGSVPAQYKLGLLYWDGHGVAKDENKAYFWALVAGSSGEEGSQDLAKLLANRLTPAQAATIERQAEIWRQQHESSAKPRH